MNRLPPHWRDGLACVAFWIAMALLAAFALYGRDVEAMVIAWRLG